MLSEVALQSSGRCGCLGGAQFRPVPPSALTLVRRGRVTWAPWHAKKKGCGVTPRRGSPNNHGHLAAEWTNAPLLPAPRQCERTARLHALRRAAAAARLGPPVLGTTRHRLPPKRDADEHGLGLLAAPRFGLPAAEFSTTTTTPAPVAFRSRERRVTKEARRGRAKRRAAAAGLGGCGSFTK